LKASGNKSSIRPNCHHCSLLTGGGEAISGGVDETSRLANISLTNPLDGVPDLLDGVLLLLLLDPKDEFSNKARVAANDAIFFTLLPGVVSITDGDRCQNVAQRSTRHVNKIFIRHTMRKVGINYHRNTKNVL